MQRDGERIISVQKTPQGPLTGVNTPRSVTTDVRSFYYESSLLWSIVLVNATVFLLENYYHVVVLSNSTDFVSRFRAASGCGTRQST